jgi:hypothetical protein
MISIDAMLEEQRNENVKAAAKPCDLATAQAQHAFLKGWAKKKPITKYGDESSTFWKAGKWMTKIPPGEVTGMIKHGLAVRDVNILRLL